MDKCPFRNGLYPVDAMFPSQSCTLGHYFRWNFLYRPSHPHLCVRMLIIQNPIELSSDQDNRGWHNIIYRISLPLLNAE